MNERTKEILWQDIARMSFMEKERYEDRVILDRLLYWLQEMKDTRRLTKRNIIQLKLILDFTFILGRQSVLEDFGEWKKLESEEAAGETSDRDQNW